MSRTERTSERARCIFVLSAERVILISYGISRSAGIFVLTIDLMQAARNIHSGPSNIGKLWYHNRFERTMFAVFFAESAVDGDTTKSIIYYEPKPITTAPCFFSIAYDLSVSPLSNILGSWQWFVVSVLFQSLEYALLATNIGAQITRRFGYPLLLCQLRSRLWTVRYEPFLALGSIKFSECIISRIT